MIDNNKAAGARSCVRCGHDEYWSKSGTCGMNMGARATIPRPCGCKCVFEATEAEKGDALSLKWDALNERRHALITAKQSGRPLSSGEQAELAALQTVAGWVREILSFDSWSPLVPTGADLISREEAARVAESMRPSGGRMWTDEQHVCFTALTDCAANIRALPSVQQPAHLVSREEVVNRLEKVIRLWNDDRVTMACADMIADLKSTPIQQPASPVGPRISDAIEKVKELRDNWHDVANANGPEDTGHYLSKYNAAHEIVTALESLSSTPASAGGAGEGEQDRCRFFAGGVDRCVLSVGHDSDHQYTPDAAPTSEVAGGEEEVVATNARTLHD